VLRLRKLPAAATSPEVIRGTVRQIFYSNFKHNLVLWIDAQRVALERSPAPMAIALGDQVLVAGTRQQGTFKAVYYIDETNGDNSVDESRGNNCKLMFAGAAGILAGLAVLATVGIAAYHEPAFFSSGGVGRAVIYLISAAGALALGAVSLFVLMAGAFAERLITAIDKEHRKSAPSA